MRDGESESLQLEFKGARALSKTAGVKKEITKDASAMANSAGGTIIYGIAEDATVAARMDPVDRVEFSKEWLEQVLDGIQPNLDGAQCHDVRNPADPDQVVYVLEIPQAKTAHQARDMRYHKRQDTHTVFMSDYEIRDVMGRQTDPLLAVALLITRPVLNQATSVSERHLIVYIRNEGRVLARHVSGVAQMSATFVDQSEIARVAEKMPWFVPFVFPIEISNVDDKLPVPILPGTSRTAAQVKLADAFDVVCRNEPTATIDWVLYADNAPCRTGKEVVAEITGDVNTLNLFRTD